VPLQTGDSSSVATAAAAQVSASLEDLARRYLIDLIRLDTTNPPGNETRVAQYLKTVCDAEGIASETLGGDPARLNFIARIKGSGKLRPLILMAHSDVVPADRSQWTVDPSPPRSAMDCSTARRAGRQIASGRRAGGLGRLEAHCARLDRDVILLSEADEEAGSTVSKWLIANAWTNQRAVCRQRGGFAITTASGQRIYEIQTTEKIPTRVILSREGHRPATARCPETITR